LYGIQKMDASPNGIQVGFVAQPPLDPVKLIRLVQSNSQVQLNGQDRIKYLPAKGSSFDQLEKRIEAIRQLMKLLSTALVASAHPLPVPTLSSIA